MKSLVFFCHVKSGKGRERIEKRPLLCTDILQLHELHHSEIFIRESVDSLCRDGADAQYMQYLKGKAV